MTTGEVEIIKLRIQAIKNETTAFVERQDRAIADLTQYVEGRQRKASGHNAVAEPERLE